MDWANKLQTTQKPAQGCTLFQHTLLVPEIRWWPTLELASWTQESNSNVITPNLKPLFCKPPPRHSLVEMLHLDAALHDWVQRSIELTLQFSGYRTISHTQLPPHLTHPETLNSFKAPKFPTLNPKTAPRLRNL